MIKCAVKLGGARMKDRLLYGLNEVNDSLKIYIIGILAEHAGRDESVLTALCELAEAKKQFPIESEYNILSAMIHALRFFPSWRSIDLLGRLRNHYDKVSGSDHLLLEIEQSLKILSPQLRHNQQRPEDNEDKVTFDSDPLQKQLAFNKAAKTEEKVKKLVHEGNVEDAGQLLYNHALAAAQEKDFVTAEMLRDRVLEVNPMALTEVIELGELIEEQKTTLVSSHHIEIWGKLYDELTIEEFNVLYQALRQEDYRKGDPIIEAGESDESLYFLNSGYISLNCISNGKEQFLKRMVPSDVLGSEQLFSASVWTVTLRALSDVQVQVLDHTTFREISDRFPDLEDKLQRYCEKYSTIPELLKMSGDDRREYPRYPITLRTQNYLRDPFGVKGSRKFNGELIDISRNGLAFAIKISSKNNAKLLLGRHIVADVFAKNESLIHCSGVIVGVRTPALAAQTFTVHVKLSKKIDDAVLKNIISQAH